MIIADKLKIIQNISGLTQEVLAKKLGVSFATFNSWINEKSKPRRNAQKRIDDLYRKYTGQKIVPDDTLKAKKDIIISKSKKYKDILKKILENSDIYDQFILSLTYHTNRLEGSTLTQNETGAILFDNIALANRSMVEQLEVKNHQAALEYLFDYFHKRSPKINEELILKLHSVLMNGIKSDAGFYRKHGVRILGTNIPTANYLKVPILMNKLIKDINLKQKDMITQITKIHSCFEQIHPFSDGNGRIGRLIMQAMLLINNLPPAIIKQEKKRFYNNGLKRSQLNENFFLLEDFICDAILKGFNILERKPF
jgi:Fic family protein/DNA-binding XRE family transcriptional regulator